MHKKYEIHSEEVEACLFALRIRQHSIKIKFVSEVYPRSHELIQMWIRL